MPDEAHSESEDGERASPGAQAAVAVQNTAKWLISAFAAIGGLIIAGLQVSALASTEHLTAAGLVVALICYAVALLGVGTIILTAAGVLLPAFDSLGEVAARQARSMTRAAQRRKAPESVDALQRALRLRRFSLFRSGVADNAKDLDLKRQELEHAVSASTKGQASLGERGSTEERSKAIARSVERDARRVVEFANSWEAMRRFRRLRVVLVIGGVATAAAVAGFSVALRPPSGKANNPDPAAIEAPLRVIVYFPDRPSVVSAIGVNCDKTVLNGAAVGGTLTDPIVVTEQAMNCPAVQFRLGDTGAVAVPVLAP